LKTLSLNALSDWVTNSGKKRRSLSKWVVFCIKGRGYPVVATGGAIDGFARAAKRYNGYPTSC
jgi:hypothetical protein